jgi:hypothetical protein
VDRAGCDWSGRRQVIDPSLAIEILNAVLATLAVLAGFVGVYAYLQRSQRSERERDKLDVQQISAAVAASAEEARSRALETIAEKLPKTETPEQLVAALEKMTTSTLNVMIESPSTDKTLKRSLVEDLVNSYHLQALSQARHQFYFSLAAAVVGFIYIMVMVALSFQTPGADLILRVLPGIAIEAVAALFFRQAEQTRERATALYDRLRSDDQRTQALGLIETVTNEDVKSLAKAHMALHMAGLTTPPLEPANWLELARKRVISTDWASPRYEAVPPPELPATRPATEPPTH